MCPENKISFYFLIDPNAKGKVKAKWESTNPCHLQYPNDHKKEDDNLFETR